MIGLVCRKKIRVTLSFWRDSIFAVSNQDLYCCRKAKHGPPNFLSYDLERSIMPEEVKSDKNPPEADFEIEYVYGYRADDCQ